MCHIRPPLLTACTSSFSLFFPLCICVTSSRLCERVRLHRARGRSSTCGTSKVNCSPAAVLPSGRRQTSCASASHSATSGIPETWSSPAVQTASYGWGFLLCGPLLPRLLPGAQTDSQAACFGTFSLGFLYSFKCSSHYFSQVATWTSINELITTPWLCVVANSAASLQSSLNCKLGCTREWASILHVQLAHTYKRCYCCIITWCYGMCVCVVAYASAVVIMLNYIWFCHSLCVSHTDMEDRVHQNTITWPSRRARIPRARPNGERR